MNILVTVWQRIKENLGKFVKHSYFFEKNLKKKNVWIKKIEQSTVYEYLEAAFNFLLDQGIEEKDIIMFPFPFFFELFQFFFDKKYYSSSFGFRFLFSNFFWIFFFWNFFEKKKIKKKICFLENFVTLIKEMI